MKPVRMISLFAGVGGLELGLEAALGVEVIAQVEVDPYCRAVLERHWPDAMRLNDVTAAIPTGLRCDVLCGGFPCQPHSAAGSRRGSDDERHLWPAMMGWILATTPRLVVAENVTGLLTSSEGEVFSSVLSDLHRAGYDAHWRTIGASDVGAPHRRRRVFIVGVRRGAKPLRLPPEVRPVWGHAGWPAGPGQPQHAYEPPRVAAGVPLRRHRLKALGNAVVPHCAYAAGRWARSLLAAPPSPEGRVVVQFLAGRRAARQPDLFAQDTAAAPRWPKHGALVAGAVRVARGQAHGTSGLAWLTATASDANGSGSRNTPGSAAHPGVSLTDAVRGDGGTGRAWPSPDAHVSNIGEGVETWEARRDELKAKGINGNGAGMPLAIAVQKDWPTPRASESEMGTYAPCPSHGVTHGRQLQAEVIALDGDPTAPAPGQKRAEIGALNPAWVELLMGFPTDWTIATYTPERKKAPKKKDT